MKKKTVSVILILALAASVTACGNSGTNRAGSVSGSAVSEESGKTDSDEIIITADDMQSYLEEVEITTDNWEEYFSVEDYSYVAEDGSWDAKPGETVNAKILKPNADIVVSNDLKMHFTYTQTCTGAFYFNSDTGEEYTGDSLYDPQDDVGETSEENATVFANSLYRGFGILYRDKSVSSAYGINDGNDYSTEQSWDVQDLKLRSCAGSVYQVNIPEDKWNEDAENGRYLVLEDEYTNMYLFESGAYGYSAESGSVESGDDGSASWPWDSILETLNAETEETKDPDSVTYQAYAAEDIQSDMYSDLGAAMEKYEGQYVEITGILERAEVSESSTPPSKVVYLETTVEASDTNGGILFAAYAWDDEWLPLEDYEEAIADMQEGDTVLLRGYIAPGDIDEDGPVRLMSMELIDVKKQ